MYKKVAIFCGLFIIITGFHVDSSDIDVTNQLITKVISASNNSKKMSYDISNCERIGGQMKCGSQQVIMQQSPFKCRILFITPKEGDQLIFNKEIGKEATYVPIGFPYINLSLNPFGERMRKDNHHTIFELGYSFFTKLIQHYYTTQPTSFSTQRINNNEIRITSSISNFQYIKYTAQKTESIRSLAKNKNISEHLIYERNNKIRHVQAGETILIPNFYYKKMVIEVDQDNFLPYSIKVYDDKDLFESYTFSNVNTDPLIDDKTFINSDIK